MRRQRGMSIVVALFVVVVVASLAAFAVTVGGAQRQSESTNLMSNRALAAARTGLEWGVYRTRTPGWCDVGAPAAKTQTLALAEGALRGFQVTVRCTGHQHLASPGVSYYSYDIEATGSYGRFGTTDFASRSVSGHYFTSGY